MSLSKNLRVVAALGTVSGALWAGTFASFSDEATSASTFSTGTVNLELADDTDDDYDFASLTTSNMKPGDVKFASLKVENAGSIASKYTMTSAETGSAPLSSALRLMAVTGAETCDAAGVGVVGSLLGGVTAVIPDGPLADAAISSARNLAATSSETLCFRVELPANAANTLQGLTTSSTFTFSLVQQ